MGKFSHADRKKWTTFIGIPFQMLAIVFLGYWLGSFLDNKYHVGNSWWTIGLTLFAVLLSLYQLIVQVRRLDNKK